MRKLIPEHFAANSILVILSLVVCFHLLVISGVVPFQIVWGGRLQNREQMLQFETVSILLNLLMLVVVATKAGYLNLNLPPLMLRILLGTMAGLFASNTVGNLFSENELEKLLFTPLTFLLTILCFRLTMGKRKTPDSQLVSD